MKPEAGKGLAEYEAEYAAYDASVMALTGGQPLDSLHPYWVDWVKKQNQPVLVLRQGQGARVTDLVIQLGR